MMKSEQTRSRARGYALAATAIAVASGLVLLPLGLPRGPTWLGWCAGGWALMAATGVVGGALLASRYGNPASGFIVIMVACVLIRLFGVLGGAAAAVWLGGVAPGSFLVGVAVGFVPLQIFEGVWFYRAGRELASDPGAHRGRRTEYGGQKATG